MSAMEFPLIEQELVRLGRRKATYAMRAVPIALAVLAILFNVLTMLLFRSIGPSGVSGQDTEYDLQFARGIQFAIVLLLAPVLAAIAIAREKQDRTLGLLALAEFRGTDIYAAKFASVLLVVGSLIAVLMPIYVTGVVLEGVTFGKIAIEYSALILMLVLVTVVGLFCSSVSSRPADAVIMTYMAVIACFFLAWNFATRLGDSPPDWPLLAWGARVGLPLIAVIVFIVGVVIWTVRLLGRASEEKAFSRTRSRRRTLFGSEKGGVAAVYCGAAQSSGSAWMSPPRHWIVVVVTVLIAIALQQAGWFPLHWLVLFILAYDIISTVEGCERQGTLDVLGCTPAGDRALAYAVVKIHFLRGLVFFPALAIGSVTGLFSSPSPIGYTFDSPNDMAWSAGAVCAAILSDIIFLLVVTAISSVVALRGGGTARRLVFIVLHYFLVGFISTMLTVAVVMIPSLSITANPNYARFSMVALSAGSAFVSSIFAYGYYIRLAERISCQWRNGGSTRLVVNPQIPTAWPSR